jgi:hypothetical protein
MADCPSRGVDAPKGMTSCSNCRNLSRSVAWALGIQSALAADSSAISDRLSYCRHPSCRSSHPIASSSEKMEATVPGACVPTYRSTSCMRRVLHCLLAASSRRHRLRQCWKTDLQDSAPTIERHPCAEDCRLTAPPLRLRRGAASNSVRRMIQAAMYPSIVLV